MIFNRLLWASKVSKILFTVTSVFLFAPIAYGAFSDVPENHPNAVAIYHLQNDDIVGGYADGTFGPNREISRAEFTKIVMETLVRQTHLTSQIISPATCLSNVRKVWVGPGSPFPDVDYTSWYGSYVCQAHHHNIILGHPDGSFHPQDPINAVEAIRIIIRTFEADLPLSTGLDTSARNAQLEPGAQWFAYDLYKAQYYQLLPSSIQTAIDQENFNHHVTRAEMAEMIYRVRVWPFIWPYQENFKPLSLAAARDVRRGLDLNTILNALRQYALDHDGQFPVPIPASSMEICAEGAKKCDGFIDLSLLIGPYLLHLPKDPLTATEQSTRYTISRFVGDALKIAAPDAEKSEVVYPQ